MNNPTTETMDYPHPHSHHQSQPQPLPSHYTQTPLPPPRLDSFSSGTTTGGAASASGQYYLPYPQDQHLSSHPHRLGHPSTTTSTHQHQIRSNSLNSLQVPQPLPFHGGRTGSLQGQGRSTIFSQGSGSMQGSSLGLGLGMGMGMSASQSGVRRSNIHSLLSASEGHRGTCRGLANSRVGSGGLRTSSSSGLRLCAEGNGKEGSRNYISNWRKEVGEANVAGSEEEEVSVPAMGADAGTSTLLKAPELVQRDSNFSTGSDTHADGERAADVQADVPLNVYATAVNTSEAKHEDQADADAVRREAIKQDNAAKEFQARAQTVEQKKMLADKMMQSVHDLMTTTWPTALAHDSPKQSTATASSSSDAGTEQSADENDLVPLKMFIREILKRSKSSCATLRCAEWYLLRLRKSLICDDASSTSSSESSEPDLSRLGPASPLLCPRRAFLSALILAHKFLHDRVYSNRAWAKVSGLDVTEVGKGELAFACQLDWKLWVGRDDSADADPEMNETSWFTSLGSTVPAPTKTPATASPSACHQERNLHASPTEVATQCSSAASSPVNGMSMSSLGSAPKLGHAQAASTFSAAASSFSSQVSPCRWPQNGGLGLPPRKTPTRSTRVDLSGIISLSSSMPGLSLDGSSDASGSSPQTYDSHNDHASDVHIVTHGHHQQHNDDDNQIQIQLTASPSSFSERSERSHASYNPRKRGSPLEAREVEGDAGSRDEADVVITGKKRRVTADRAMPTRMSSLS